MKKTSVIIGIILFLLGAVLLFAGRRFIVPAFSTPVDIVEEGMEAVAPNTAVETDLYMVFERFSRRDSRDYHVIPVWSGEYGYVIPLSISSENAGDYTQVVDETMDYAYGYTNDYGTETVHFQGVVLELDDTTSGKMRDWFREVGFFERESDMDDAILPYMLYQVNLTGVKENTILFAWIMIVGLVFLCIGIFLPSEVKVSLKLKETKINGVTYRVEQFRVLNSLLMKGKKQEAQKILTEKFNVDSSYAAFVVDNWNEYFY
ncbi:MAG: hypothetical protein K2N44_03860 [Lachnospiraceae bacterium]|nr:hypothetical protein [Lachnospiraceae bacterium]MDE7415441.1 hypothetical protein [Lachnospiraceae bacterium]